MHDFKCDPGMEITGQTLLSYVDNARSDIIKPLSEKHGMTNINPEEWYPLQPVLDVLKALSMGPNASENLVALGIEVAEYSVEPEDIIDAPLSFVLEHWQDHLDYNFRHGDPGKVITEKIHDKFYKVTQINMFPDDFCYGLTYGFARRRLPLGTNFKVWYEEGIKRIDEGGNKTVICIEWE